MTDTPLETGQKNDRSRLAATVLAFGFSLGCTTIAFPLLAIDSGFSASVVGLLAALSAAVQMGTRFILPWLLGRVADRRLLSAALVTMAVSSSVLLFASSGVAFVVAQIFQGAARGIFWTSSQTHAVRMPGIAAKRLGFIQAMGQLGGLAGPIVAGILASIALTASLWAALVFAVIGVFVALTLHLLPPYERAPRSERKPIWRTSGVGVGSWAASIGGAWRGILDSFVPVVLESSGYAPSTIGWLMSTADGSGLAATSSVARWGRPGMARLVPWAAAGLAAGLIVLPLSSHLVTAVGSLVVAGFSGGLAGVLGSTSINESVDKPDQGAALALVGAYRAGARAVAPATISVLLAIASVPLSLAVAALGVISPIVVFRRR